MDACELGRLVARCAKEGETTGARLRLVREFVMRCDRLDDAVPPSAAPRNGDVRRLCSASMLPSTTAAIIIIR